MKKKDESFKRYFQKPYIVKDLLNAMYYDGEQIIQEEDITEENIENVSHHLSKTYRDLLFTVKVRNQKVYRIRMIGLEAQSTVDPFMALRILQYDTEIVLKQMENNRDNKDMRLIQPETIVLNFSNRKWDAPLSLQEMFAYPQTTGINDSYRVIDIHDLDERFVRSLKTELQSVLRFMEKQNDHKALDELIHSDERFSRLSRDGAVFLSENTGTQLEFNEGKEEIDMCKAWEEQRRLGEEAGRLQGIEQGKLQGIEQGKLQGIQIGEEKVKQQIIFNMFAMGMDISVIAKAVGMEPEEILQFKSEHMS